MNPLKTSFAIKLAKEDFKFNAAHFVAYEGFRERLHGHNYRVGIRLFGSHQICSDGYVLDFGDVKKSARKICKSMNEYFLCPTYSDVIKISTIHTTTTDEDASVVDAIQLDCEDGGRFVFPRKDVLMLPIAHSTAEELAVYIWQQILIDLGIEKLRKRGIHTMEITVYEAVEQGTNFRMEIPDPSKEESINGLDVRQFIRGLRLLPSKCLDVGGSDDMIQNLNQKMNDNLGIGTSDGVRGNDTTNGNTTNSCICLEQFSNQLETLAKAMNNGELLNGSANPKQITTADLQRVLRHHQQCTEK